MADSAAPDLRKSIQNPGTRNDRDEPNYVRLWRSGELAERARAADRHMLACDLCARYCRVNRKKSAQGAVCRTGAQAVVYSFGPHHGEEDCLRGWNGSGTIFFSWCNLRCLYCQNWEISWRGEGQPVTAEKLAEMMLNLQRRGCHNVNFVSPSHVVAQILEALVIAVDGGLRLPLIYNTGGYDSPEALALLDGVIDIYMPDMKYSDADTARRLSKVRDYPKVNQAAVREMHRQVGDLVIDAEGLARRGLLVRHLVLPNDCAGSDDIVRFLAEEISPDTYLNLMDQYRPCYRAADVPEVNRPITRDEFDKVLRLAAKHGMHRLDHRVTRSWLHRLL